ncbi:hypothetical protein EYC84_007624 [Monilinia fructicola]|uniref:Uncharacterized protein n=1 Tax=Monilinia fructicola TaxID=38448 RepID=A0A5M9JKW2_MONFR|nr:hypothetical protein EYC84_007624 [Monilinia fructicola]
MYGCKPGCLYLFLSPGTSVSHRKGASTLIPITSAESTKLGKSKLSQDPKQGHEIIGINGIFRKLARPLNSVESKKSLVYSNER